MKKFLRYTLIVSLFVLCALALTVLGASAATPPSGAATDDGTSVAKIEVSSVEYFYTDLNTAVTDALDNSAGTVTVLKDTTVTTQISITGNMSIVGAAGTETVTNSTGGYLFKVTGGTLTVKNLTVATTGSFVDISGTASLVIGEAGGNNNAITTTVGGNASTNALIKVTAAMTGDITVYPGARLYYNGGDLTGTNIHMIQVAAAMTGALTLDGKIEFGSAGNYLIGSGADNANGTDVICVSAGTVDIAIGGTITAYLQSTTNRVHMIRLVAGVRSVNITGAITLNLGPDSINYVELLSIACLAANGITINGATLTYNAGTAAMSATYNAVIYSINNNANVYTITDSTISMLSENTTALPIFYFPGTASTVNCTNTVFVNDTPGPLFAGSTPASYYVRFATLAAAETSAYANFLVEDGGYCYIYPTLKDAAANGAAGQPITVLKNYTMSATIAPSRDLIIVGKTADITITTANTGTNTVDRFYEATSGTRSLTLRDLTFVGTTQNLFLSRSSANVTYNFDNVTINSPKSLFYCDGSSTSSVTIANSTVTVSSGTMFSFAGTASATTLSLQDVVLHGNLINSTSSGTVCTPSVSYTTDAKAIAGGYAIRLGTTAGGNVGTVYFNDLATLVNAIPTDGSGTAYVLAPTTITSGKATLLNKSLTLVGPDATVNSGDYDLTLNFGASNQIFYINHHGSVTFQNLRVSVTGRLLTVGANAGAVGVYDGSALGSDHSMAFTLTNTWIDASFGYYLFATDQSGHSNEGQTSANNGSSWSGNRTNHQVTITIDSDSTLNAVSTTSTESHLCLFWQAQYNAMTIDVDGVLNYTCTRDVNKFRVVSINNPTNVHLDVDPDATFNVSYTGAAIADATNYCVMYATTGSNWVSVPFKCVTAYTDGMYYIGNNLPMKATADTHTTSKTPTGVRTCTDDAAAIALGGYFRLGAVGGNGYAATLQGAIDAVADGGTGTIYVIEPVTITQTTEQYFKYGSRDAYSNSAAYILNKTITVVGLNNGSTDITFSPSSSVAYASLFDLRQKGTLNLQDLKVNLTKGEFVGFDNCGATADNTGVSTLNLIRTTVTGTPTNYLFGNATSTHSPTVVATASGNIARNAKIAINVDSNSVIDISFSGTGGSSDGANSNGFVLFYFRWYVTMRVDVDIDGTLRVNVPSTANAFRIGHEGNFSNFNVDTSDIVELTLTVPEAVRSKASTYFITGDNNAGGTLTMKPEHYTTFTGIFTNGILASGLKHVIALHGTQSAANDTIAAGLGLVYRLGRAGNVHWYKTLTEALAAIPTDGSGTICLLDSVTITAKKTNLQRKNITIVGRDLAAGNYDIVYNPSSPGFNDVMFQVDSKGSLTFENARIQLTGGGFVGFDNRLDYYYNTSTSTLACTLTNTHVSGTVNGYVFGTSYGTHSPTYQNTSVTITIDADSSVSMNLNGTGGTDSNHFNNYGYYFLYMRWRVTRTTNLVVSGSIDITVGASANAFRFYHGDNCPYINLTFNTGSALSVALDAGLPTSVSSNDELAFTSSTATKTLTVAADVLVNIYKTNYAQRFVESAPTITILAGNIASDADAILIGANFRLGDTASGNYGTVYFANIKGAADTIPANGSGTIHVLAPATVTSGRVDLFNKDLTIVGPDATVNSGDYDLTLNYGASNPVFYINHHGSVTFQNLRIHLTGRLAMIGANAGAVGVYDGTPLGNDHSMDITFTNAWLDASFNNALIYTESISGANHSTEGQTSANSGSSWSGTRINHQVTISIDDDSTVNAVSVSGSESHLFLFYQAAYNAVTIDLDGALSYTCSRDLSKFRFASVNNPSNFHVDIDPAASLTVSYTGAAIASDENYCFMMTTTGSGHWVHLPLSLTTGYSNGMYYIGTMPMKSTVASSAVNLTIVVFGAGAFTDDADAVAHGCYFRLGDVEGSGYYSSLADLIADLEVNTISGETVTRHLQTAYLLQNHTTNATFYITSRSLRITSVGDTRLTLTLNASIPFDLISGSQLILGNVEVVATQRFMRFRYNDTAAKNIFTMENGSLLRATGGDGNFIYVNLSDGPNTPGVIEINLREGSTIRREAIGSGSALLFNLDNSTIVEGSTITVAGTVQNNCGALGGKGFSMFRSPAPGLSLHITSTARLSTTATGGPTNSSMGAMIAMAGAVTVDAGGTAQDPQFTSTGDGVVAVFALQWSTNAYTINGVPTFDLGTAPAGNFSAYMVNRQSDAMSVRVTDDWVATEIFGATIRVGDAPTNGDYAYMYHDYFSGFNSLCAAVTHTENSTVLSDNDTIYLLQTQNITNGCTLLSTCTGLQLVYPTDAPAFRISSGTVVLYDLAINQCNTFAEISGTGRLDFSRGVTFTATAATASALHGTAMIELSGGGKFYMNYHSAGAPSMTFTGAATLDTPYTVFHTSTDWNGVISIAGTILYGWATTGNSSIFNVEGTGTSGLILLAQNGNIRHTGTVGSGATTTMVRSAAGEGSGVQMRILNETTFKAYFKIHDITVQDTDAAYQLRIGHITPRHQYTAYIFGYPWDVVCVNVTWGDLGFTYTRGMWNPVTHTYGEGTWAVNQEGGDKITVTNVGDVVVRASVSFAAASGYSMFGGAFTESGEPVSGSVLLTSPNIKVSGATKEFTFSLSTTGTPADMQNQAVGSVTVTIAANDRNVAQEMTFTNQYGTPGYNHGDGNGAWKIGSSNGGVYRSDGVFYQAYYGGDNLYGVIQRYDKNTQQTVYSKIFLNDSVDITGSNYVNVSMGHLNGITYNSNLNKVVVAPGSGTNDDGTPWGGRYVLLLDGDDLSYDPVSGKIDTDFSCSGIAFVPQATIRGITYTNFYVCLSGSIKFYEEDFQPLRVRDAQGNVVLDGENEPMIVPSFATGMDSYAEVGQCIGADADHVYFLCNTYSYPFTQDTIVRVYSYEGELVDYIRIPIPDAAPERSGQIHAENITPIGDHLYIMGSGNPTMVLYKIAKEYDK